MSSILGLKNFIKSDTSEKLVVAYGNDIGVFDGISAFAGQGRNLSSVKMEFDVFLDYLIGVNGTDRNQVYNGTWFNGGARTRMPIASLVKTVGNKIYIANLSYANINYRSRVWNSDLPKNDDITWGYETGTNLVATAGSSVVTSAFAGFATYNIKVGDPFFITTGNNVGQYTVNTIDSDQQITLVEVMKFSTTGSTYWVGSNWFDARRNDGDTIKGLGENDNKLLVFKRESLLRYDEKELRRVKGAPGTTSHRSIASVRENTYYFHDTGVYRYDGLSSFLVSRPIQDWIDGISSNNYESIVSWRDEDILYIFVGDISNAPKGISLSNGVLIYDTAAQAWDIGMLNDTVTVANETTVSGTRTVYLGNTSDEVLTWNSGTADISAPIPWSFATIYHFPGGVYNVVDFEKVEVHTIDGRGISLYYKLYGTNSIDNQWQPLGDINDDVTTFYFKRGVRGRGIAFKFQENSTRSPTVLGRIDIWVKDRSERNLPNITNA